MELELGLKITHNRDDITSHANLRIAKDFSGPLLLSKETETMFFLIVYLKGFRRENIDIDINKDGTRITISGTRAVQEMVLSGWIMNKKDVELRAFKKDFKIPDGVILDKIKAKFNDQDASLKIIMPKLVKGMRGFEIQEVKEEEEQTQKEPGKVPEEPGRRKMEEIQKIERTEPDIPRNEDRVAKQSEERDIERDDENEQVSEMDEVIPEHGRGKLVEEKPEELEIDKLEETKKVHRKPTKKVNFVEEFAESERSKGMELEEKAETESGKESEETISEMSGSSDMTDAYQESTDMETEGVESEKKIKEDELNSLIPDKEISSEQDGKESLESEIVEDGKTEEQSRMQESTASTEPVLDEVMEQQQEENLPNESEQEEVTEELQELKEEKPESNDEEPEKPEPGKEENLPETEQWTEQSERDEENGEKDRQYRKENEIEEDVNDQEKLSENERMEEQESVEREKQKEAAEEVEKTKRKLCPPLVVAGSAILASLIVLLITLIRSKRR